MNNEIELPALKYKQNGETMFLFLAEAEFIYDKFDVSRRTDDKEFGYQRSFSSKKIRQIKSYLLNEKGIIPNSILVNIDHGKHSYNSSSNSLVLKNDDSIGFIIDGQHRVKGSYEAQKNLLLPIVATVDLETKNQAQLFVKVNTTQKAVPSSLYLDLLDLIDGVIEDFGDENIPAERRAVEIAKRLNEEEESPLHNLVRLEGMPGRGIALSEFVSHVKPYVDPKSGKLLDYGFEHQYMIFKIYFKAVKAVFLEQWDDEKTLILKTVGFGGLMRAFYDIFTLVTQHHKQFSTNNTINTLELIKDFKFDSDNLPGGGFKGQDNAGKLIVSALRKAMREDAAISIEIVE
ncbi:MAG: DGQHR domain-containing protein [Gammaproteobacteria bacterium]|nr:DGQHR domain-containing protein [Gammaproteobacteria bacterium]